MGPWPVATRTRSQIKREESNLNRPHQPTIYGASLIAEDSASSDPKPGKNTVLGKIKFKKTKLGLEGMTLLTAVIIMPPSV
jgi:hypothetical protein